ncbi:Hemerythrin [Frankia canadensis]|uniref:Hemerythrin n=1 Tax=Frankia canadensis TaxID=1836972 RepID=A0A2I2KNA3_9ACTN|nr:hemerythrin domain-containing protein [Frankia canadensis]SNQ47129.1 Hemerythrin [Frankia canadensis]SOU54419.1 Hemerythrin [Frankia canadensis]
MTRTEADAERAAAAGLPEDDVVGILLTQHARIRDLFAEVRTATGEHKERAFDELRALLAAHETAEEMIVRPVSRQSDRQLAEACNEEEHKATKMLSRLEKMDVHSDDFAFELARFEQSVSEHAEHEEREEFPRLRAARQEEQLETMGRRLRTAERFAPTHPHASTAGSTTAQWTVGPIASIIDRVRDAVR